MKKTVKRGRPVGSKNKPKSTAKKMTEAETLLRLRNLVDKQDNIIEQSNDQISDLRAQVDFFRKQVNHFLALLNILARGQ